jgi:alpha-L-fucosidase
MEPTLAEVGLFKQAMPVPAPALSERGGSGLVTIVVPEGKSVVYTTDGTLPTLIRRCTAPRSPCRAAAPFRRRW